jgi:hypothetical protein
MAELKYKCIGECKKEFKHGDWECFPGVKHLVEPKSYYINDAPHCDFVRDPEGLAYRSSRATVYIIPEKASVDELGKKRTDPARAVEFVKGQYTTRDPEEQFFIERAKIDVGYDRWFEAYHTPKQKQNIKGNSLEMREKKLRDAQAEENALLERVRKLKEEAAQLEEKKTVKAGK